LRSIVDVSLTLIEKDRGRPFAGDAFNVQQRSLAGALPKHAIVARVAAGTLTIVEVDQHTHWIQSQTAPYRLESLEAPSVESVLSEKVLAEDRSSRLNNCSQDRDRIHSAVESLAAARGLRQPQNESILHIVQYQLACIKTVINWKANCSW
jgi:hypothetical protein